MIPVTASPQHKLQISTGFILGQIADARAEIVKGAAKQDLIHASVQLDDANFMKPDFGINVENIQNLVLVSISVLHHSTSFAEDSELI